MVIRKGVKKAVKKTMGKSLKKKPQAKKFIIYFYKSKQGGGLCIYKNPNMKKTHDQQRFVFRSRKEAREVIDRLISKYCQEPIKGLNKVD